MGAATAAHLRELGEDVVGVDLHDAEVIADLGTPDGRREAVKEALRLTAGTIDRLILCAGISPRNPDGLVVSVNYFGVTALLDGLAEALSRGETKGAAVISSAVVYGGWYGLVSGESVERCLAGDEAGARAAADQIEHSGYASAKLALAHDIRRRAASDFWIGNGMTLNGIAPGVIRTPMTAPSLSDPNWTSSVPPPFGRVGETWEVAGLLEFLTGKYARFITGQIVYIDGGAEVRDNVGWIHARSVLERPEPVAHAARPR
jgi:NAD(P)-dependent dehydrogenase (short-subunit alcohol dehydrogenase family)